MKKIAVGILAHVDSGKTTLSEAMLYLSGSISKLGRVDRRNSFLDTFRLERERGITIFSKQARLSFGDLDITLLDTPGHVDFSAETERTLQVLDYAILVISGTDGVQSHTQTLWKLLRRYEIPCFVFVNKMDIDGADRGAVMRELRDRLSDRCVDFGDTDELDENLALCDDRLLESFDRNGTLSDGEIAGAVLRRRVFPCMFGSALRLDGVGEFMKCLDRLTVMPDCGDEFAAKVFKISEDNQGNRLTHIKLTGGTLRVKEVLDSPGNASAEKVNQIRIYSGDKFTTPQEVSAGTVCAVTGVTFAHPGDGLGAEEDSDLPVLEPVLTYSVILPEDTDAHTALSKLRVLEEEDPQLGVVWNERLGEIQLRLMGEIQLEVLRSIILERFGIEVSFGEGNIIYKETIADKVEGVGHFEPLRHYAEVHLLLKPRPRNSGLLFGTDCSEDMLDRNWQRLILTHLMEKTHLGVLTGSPITDMEITLVSGRAHAKHTEGGDFRQATYRAVRQGLRRARSVLLEPVYEFTLDVPSANIGRAMSDVQRMYGSFEPPETDGEFSRLRGVAPVSEMRGYNREVVQYTHGEGRLMCSLKGYEVCHNQDEVIAEFGYNPDSDVENPCDSVFCSHGAGHTVKWDEISSRMHLPSVLAERSPAVEAKPGDLSAYKSQEDLFALDKELMRIFEQTYGAVKKRDTSERRHYQAAPKPNPYKHTKAPKYDGEEYLLVDGYNVIFAWDKLRALSESSIDGARQALINILCNYQGYKKCEVIVVFDAYKVKGGNRTVERENNISVVYTREAETADMYIEKVTRKLAKNRRVRVVTSDGLEQLIILGGGALRVSSAAFYEEVREAEDEIRSIIDSAQQA